MRYLIIILALSGCHHSIEVRASGTVAVDGQEPIQWVARYQAGH